MGDQKTAADEFEEADEAFTKAMRAYSDASDVLWQATKRRGLAWRRLTQEAATRTDLETGNG